MESRSFKWKLEADMLEVIVRLSIFMIIGACAGLPVLVWSVADLIHHRKNGHRISIFMFLLLLTDFIELFLSPYILLKYLLDEIPSYKDRTYWVLSCLWWSSRASGIFLNQQVALEGILSVKYPLYTAFVFSSSCFIVLSVLVFLFTFICAITMHHIINVSLVSIVLVITWITSFGALCSPDRHSHTSRKPDYHIWVVFIYTLLVLVLYPILMVNGSLFPILLIKHFLNSYIPYFLTSLRLISDPLLCMLVYRQNLRIQTSQLSEGTSLV